MNEIPNIWDIFVYGKMAGEMLSNGTSAGSDGSICTVHGLSSLQLLIFIYLFFHCFFFVLLFQTRKLLLYNPMHSFLSSVPSFCSQSFILSFFQRALLLLMLRASIPPTFEHVFTDGFTEENAEKKGR